MTSPPSESGDFATIAALIEKLQFDVDRGSNSREEAATALAAMGSKAVPALIDAVNFKKDVRKRAIFVLGNIGPAAKDAVSALLACLWNKDYSVRRMAAWALGEIGPVNEEVIPRLIGAMRTGNPKFRYSIFQALVTIGREAVTDLIARFSYRWEPEQLIDKALASFGMEVVPDLLAIVRGEDEELSQRAAGLLVTIGKDAVPDLMAAWKDESGVIRKEAARILMQIDPDLMIGILKNEPLSEDDERLLRWFEQIDMTEYQTKVQVFWCVGYIDKEAIQSAGMALGLKRLSKRLREIDPIFKRDLLPVSIGYLRETCFRGINKLFNNEPFRSEAWSPEERTLGIRSEVKYKERRESCWTPKAWKAWQYVDRFLRLQKLLPTIISENGDGRQSH